MGRNKYPHDGITVPEKIQVKLTEQERQEFYDAWKELEPYAEWASFCRKMIKKGIERVKEDHQIIKDYRERLNQNLPNPE